MTNLSIYLNHYPNSAKHGIMKPLFKGELIKKRVQEASRPVNILPGVGRVMDSIISEQQNKFIEEVNLIPKEKHSFRKMYETVTANRYM